MVAVKKKLGRKKTRDVGRKVLAEQRGEPKIADVEASTIGLIEALQYYNLLDPSDITKRDWVVEYATNHSFHKDELKKLKAINPKFFMPTEIGLIRLINRGYEASDKHVDRVKMFVTNLLKHDVEEVEKKPIALENPLVRARRLAAIKDEAQDRDFCGLLEEDIDKINLKQPYSFIDFEAYLKANGATKKNVQILKALVEKKIATYEAAKNSSDEYVKESYSCFKGKDFNRLLTYLYDVQSTIEKIENAQKKDKARATVRKARKKDPVKLTKNVKFKREGSGIEPKDIVGAKTLLTYNDKYKVFTVYRANDSDGLMIKGTKVINFNVEKSISKKLKKGWSEDFATKRNITELLDFIDDPESIKLFGKTSPTINGRINQETILVKVY